METERERGSETAVLPGRRMLVSYMYMHELIRHAFTNTHRCSLAKGHEMPVGSGIPVC